MRLTSIWPCIMPVQKKTTWAVFLVYLSQVRTNLTRFSNRTYARCRTYYWIKWEYRLNAKSTLGRSRKTCKAIKRHRLEMAFSHPPPLLLHVVLCVQISYYISCGHTKWFDSPYLPTFAQEQQSSACVEALLTHFSCCFAVFLVLCCGDTGDGCARSQWKSPVISKDKRCVFFIPR